MKFQKEESSKLLDMYLEEVKDSEDEDLKISHYKNLLYVLDSYSMELNDKSKKTN